MRDIKFRAWDGKVMHENVVVYFGSGWVENESLDPKAIHIKSSTTHLMQFTGLQDKNGVDIYEGDVLSIRGWLGEVYYKNVNGRFDVKELNEGPHGALAHKFSHGEIIGNIHSNPELLEK